MVFHWNNWVTSLFWSPIFFSVFQLILEMLWFERSRFFLRFSLHPVFFFSSLWELFQAHQLQLASPTPTRSSLFQLIGNGQIWLYIFASFLFSHYIPLGRQKYLMASYLLIFSLIHTKFSFLAKFSWSVYILKKSQRILFVLFSWIEL